MFQTHFVLQNIHFTISLIMAFIFFAVFWLYFDAWLRKKTAKDTFKLLGYLLLSISFVIYAIYVEQTVLFHSIFGSGTIIMLSSVLRILGYLALIMGMLTDPLQKRPDYTKQALSAATLLPGSAFAAGHFFLLPILSAIVGFLFLRKATVGLEDHLKPVSVAFFSLSLAELAGTSSAFHTTSNVSLLSFVAPFGPVWIVMHGLLMISAVLFARWVFQYLLTRIQTQLYIFFTTGIVVVFLLITLLYTVLLFRNMQGEAQRHLVTDVNVFHYAIEGKKSEILSDAIVVAQSPAVAQAVVAKDRKALQDVTQALFLTRKQSSLVITDKNGMVLYRAEDPERYGESLSNNTLFTRMVNTGQGFPSIVIREGVLAPAISIQSIMPIKQENALVGAVFISTQVDNAFLDGIKQATGLDAAIYAGNIRSATTLYVSDGKSRWIGIKEEDPAVKNTVLNEGKVFSGEKDLLNTSYLTAYAPLRDVNTNPVGMLLVAQEQQTVLQQAAQSTQVAFLLSTVLLCLAFIPTHFIAKYIAYQIG
jgi:hypothetical protein